MFPTLLGVAWRNLTDLGRQPALSSTRCSPWAYGLTAILAFGTCAASGSAQVVYTALNGGSGITIGAGQSTTLNFDNHGGGEATVTFQTNDGTYMYFSAANSSAIRGVINSGASSVRRLTGGESIGSGANYTSSLYIWEGTSGDNWNNATSSMRGYVGVEFKPTSDSANTHYGWVDLQINRAGSSPLVSVTIFGIAYEQVANTAISAGAGAPVPEPGAGAAIFGITAAGFALYQRRRIGRLSHLGTPRRGAQRQAGSAS